MMKDAVLTAVCLLRDLPAGEVDNFTVAFRDITAELTAKQEA